MAGVTGVTDLKLLLENMLAIYFQGRDQFFPSFLTHSCVRRPTGIGIGNVNPSPYTTLKQ